MTIKAEENYIYKVRNKKTGKFVSKGYTTIGTLRAHLTMARDEHGWYRNRFGNYRKDHEVVKLKLVEENCVPVDSNFKCPNFN